MKLSRTGSVDSRIELERQARLNKNFCPPAAVTVPVWLSIMLTFTDNSFLLCQIYTVPTLSDLIILVGG